MSHGWNHGSSAGPSAIPVEDMRNHQSVPAVFDAPPILAFPTEPVHTTTICPPAIPRPTSHNANVPTPRQSHTLRGPARTMGKSSMHTNRVAPYAHKQRNVASPSLSTPSLSTCATPASSASSLPATPVSEHRVPPVPLEGIPFLEVKRTKARNQKMDLSEGEIQAILSSVPRDRNTTCPKCGKRMLLVDLERHLRTHVSTDRPAYLCAGVPFWQRPNDGVKREVRRHPYTGELRVGGCGAAFNRKESLKRHLEKNGCKCLKPAPV